MKRVLVTRARDEAERTAEKLRRMGFEPLISPVIEIAATGAAIPDEAFDAVLATSARAIAHAGNDLSKLASLPFYVVGARTARAAEERGLRVAASTPNVAALASKLGETFGPLPTPPPLRGRGSRFRPVPSVHETPLVSVPSPAKRGRNREGATPTRFLYLAGRDRKDALETVFHDSGHELSIVEVYQATAASALSDEAIAALETGEIAAVLHYSARSAKIFLDLVHAAGDWPSLRGATATKQSSSAPAASGSLRSARDDVVHVALSEDVAHPLRESGCANVRVAPEPNEESLLGLLQRF